MDMEKIKKQSEEIYDHLKAISHGNPLSLMVKHMRIERILIAYLLWYHIT